MLDGRSRLKYQKRTLHTSKAGCIINPTDEPEPPQLKSIRCPILYDDGQKGVGDTQKRSLQPRTILSRR